MQQPSAPDLAVAAAAASVAAAPGIRLGSTPAVCDPSDPSAVSSAVTAAVTSSGYPAPDLSQTNTRVSPRAEEARREYGTRTPTDSSSGEELSLSDDDEEKELEEGIGGDGARSLSGGTRSCSWIPCLALQADSAAASGGSLTLPGPGLQVTASVPSHVPATHSFCERGCTHKPQSVIQLQRIACESLQLLDASASNTFLSLLCRYLLVIPALPANSPARAKAAPAQRGDWLRLAQPRARSHTTVRVRVWKESTHDAED